MFRCAPLVLAALLACAAHAAAQKPEATEHLLANGMRVLTLEDHTLPVMTFYSFYRVGSRNEETGVTGISHLFEHMMFNGAKKYGPEMFDHTLEAAGGSSNASTWHDKTIYYEDFPSDQLPTVLDLEADRMRDLALTAESMNHELGVVKEERRFRTENTTEGPVEEQLYAEAFTAHSYHAPVIGWMADLDSMKVESCRDYFHTYYAPNNCVVVLSGDFDTRKAMDLVERTLGTLQPSATQRRVPTPEPPQLGERRAVICRPGEVPLVALGFRGAPCTDADMPALDVLEVLLGRGESSRLYRRLVAETQLCLDAGASFEWHVDPGLLELTASVKPDKDPAEAEHQMEAVLDSLAAAPVSARELQKAMNSLESGFLGQAKTANGRTYQLGNCQVMFGDWRVAGTLLDRYRAVTAADVQRVVRKYFGADHRNVVTFLPQQEAPAEPARKE